MIQVLQVKLRRSKERIRQLESELKQSVDDQKAFSIASEIPIRKDTGSLSDQKTINQRHEKTHQVLTLLHGKPIEGALLYLQSRSDETVEAIKGMESFRRKILAKLYSPEENAKRGAKMLRVNMLGKKQYESLHWNGENQKEGMSMLKLNLMDLY